MTSMAEAITLLVQIGSITTATITVLTTLASRTYPWARTKLSSRAVSKNLGTTFIKEQLYDALRYYIPPRCQSIDPGGSEEPRGILATKQGLFETLDEVLCHSTDYRYIFLPADSGMGKTSALLNYYARHLKKWKKSFNLCIVPLGLKNPDEHIAAIPNKNQTVLLLDAFDEDLSARDGYIDRLDKLMELTHQFQRVLITSRTQFFSKEEEIPVSTGILKVGTRKAGEPAEYIFHKIYLSPFSDAEIKQYLRRRYPIWQARLRRRVLEMAKRIPNLAVRPMLLAHLDDIVNKKSLGKLACSAELYEEMVEAWLIREQGFVPNKNHLRNFSELLAVDLYANSAVRGTERVPKEEISSLASAWSIPLDSWMLTGRSLLNRDAQGNYKFAHRSIMEYLALCRLAQNDTRLLETSWTDQMKSFFWESVEYNIPWLAGAVNFPIQNEPGRQLLRSLCSDLRIVYDDDLPTGRKLAIFCAKVLSALQTGKGEVRLLEVSLSSNDDVRLDQVFRTSFEEDGVQNGYSLEPRSQEHVEISVTTFYALCRAHEEDALASLRGEIWTVLPKANQLFVLPLSVRIKSLPRFVIICGCSDYDNGGGAFYLLRQLLGMTPEDTPASSNLLKPLPRKRQGLTSAMPKPPTRKRPSSKKKSSPDNPLKTGSKPSPPEGGGS